MLCLKTLKTFPFYGSTFFFSTVLRNQIFLHTNLKIRTFLEASALSKNKIEFSAMFFFFELMARIDIAVNLLWLENIRHTWLELVELYNLFTQEKNTSFVYFSFFTKGPFIHFCINIFH